MGCSCHVLGILAAAVCKSGDVCCLPATAHQPFSSNSLSLSALEEACSRNVRALGTLKFGYEGIFRISLISGKWIIANWATKLEIEFL